jgi:hypothetical protein
MATEAKQLTQKIKNKRRKQEIYENRTHRRLQIYG